MVRNISVGGIPGLSAPDLDAQVEEVALMHLYDLLRLAEGWERAGGAELVGLAGLIVEVV